LSPDSFFVWWVAGLVVRTHTTTSLFLRIFTGDTFIDETAPKPDLRFIDKYREAVAKLGLAPEGLAASYSVAIRVRPHMVRGF